MSSISAQRDLVTAFKTETCLNIDILSKNHPMPVELSKLLSAENALEKPTQNLFNNLSHYLVSIIDPAASTLLPRLLYDSKSERNYRNELSKLILDYSNRGLVYPVMSSYMVNPGCYKVTVLIFQLSQLAVKKTLQTLMAKKRQKNISHKIYERYDLQNKDFIENISKDFEGCKEETLRLYSTYLQKRCMLEKIAFMFKRKIFEMEKILSMYNIQKYIDVLIDTFIQKNTIDETLKMEILQIKNLLKPAPIFDKILEDMDKKMDELEPEWTLKVEPFLNICQSTWKSTDELIARFNGRLDKKLYVLEFNPKTDEICTKNLQSQVNSQQKFILKNVIQDDTLNFPNLIRAFLIAICFILKNNEEGDEIYNFNQYLEGEQRNMRQISIVLKMLNDRMKNLNAKIELTPTHHNSSVSIKEFFDIPSLPDFSDIKFSRDQIMMDSFSPFSFTKHNFNLRKQSNLSVVKRQPETFIAPSHHNRPRDEFFRSLLSCHLSSYDNRNNVSHNINNMSMMSQISQPNKRLNETTAECSSGFTKQQIMRLLSTKKTSSSKKHKFKTDRPESTFKKGALFNESTSSNESNGLFRSYSSPNLYENREKRPVNTVNRRKLSIMQEETPRYLDMSGITTISNSSSLIQSISNLESSRKVMSDVNVQMNSTEKSIHQTLKEVDLDKLIINEQNELPSIIIDRHNSTEVDKESRTETPKTNTALVKKTSSLEKIINRFKKVRSSVIQIDRKDDSSEIETIIEEKENFNTINVDVITANRVLLPDLLSPSCSKLTLLTEDFDSDSDEFDPKKRKPRESLGTVLGVDHTFLDQFELLD